MTQQEMIELADKAGFFVKDNEAYSPSVQEDYELTPCLKAFAKLVVEKEREACAKAIQQSRAYQLVWYPEGYSINPNKIDSFYEFQWKRSVDAIRSRGQA